MIVSFIPETVERLSQSVRHGVPKPYFVVEEGQLALQNVPIKKKENVRMDWFRSVFGHSHLVHEIMIRAHPRYWWQDTMYDMRYVRNDSVLILELLFDRLHAQTKGRTHLVVLIQAGFDIEPIASHLQQYPASDVTVINLIHEYLEWKQRAPEQFHELHNMGDESPHLSPAGNAHVAQRVSEAIMKTKEGEPPTVQ